LNIETVGLQYELPVIAYTREDIVNIWLPCNIFYYSCMTSIDAKRLEDGVGFCIAFDVPVNKRNNSA
jgi:hypothetical protein